MEANTHVHSNEQSDSSCDQKAQQIRRKQKFQSNKPVKAFSHNKGCLDVGGSTQPQTQQGRSIGDRHERYTQISSKIDLIIN